MAQKSMQLNAADFLAADFPEEDRLVVDCLEADCLVGIEEEGWQTFETGYGPFYLDYPLVPGRKVFSIPGND